MNKYTLNIEKLNELEKTFSDEEKIKDILNNGIYS